MLRQIFLFSVSILIQQAIAQAYLPPGLGIDSSHAPFIYGVASGDPTDQSVVLWTYVDGISSGQSTVIQYEISTDSLFVNSVLTGTQIVDSSTAFTLKKQVSNLQSDTYYFYRFATLSGETSVTGRTRTAPTGNGNQLRFAVMSCSSIYSGYFNAYRRIGERNNLNAMIHLGDYIYDFVDGDEEIRVPLPLPQDPNSLHQFRDRHKYYLLDYDLRYARQMHPFIMIWDNHDLAGNATNQYKGSVKAFHEFNPTNSFNSNSPDIIYRSFQYGSLATIVMTDFEIFNGLDSSSTTEMSAWGNVQRNWIKNELNQSTAKWKIIGNQKMMGRWSSQGFAPWLNLPGNGIVFDPTSWDGHTAERLDFLNFIHSNSIDNVMVLSGDAHISMLQDLTPDFDADSIYNPNTGEGSWAVEFMPPSITRGNMDESGISSSASDLLTSGDYFANPQHVYAEFFSHGYGIIDIKSDSIIAELWYSPILQPSMTETFHKGFVVRNNENHWRRDGVILGQPPVYAKQNQQIKIHPNPATNKVWIDVPSDIDGTMELLTLNGALVNIEVKKATPTCYMITLPVLPDGMYILRYNELSGKLIISNKQ